ncbi:MAG: hypothetical protein JNK11_21380 [Alphaproteobacteria bacterium]|nr:hypothetical protein [Alphaproteobacteria bacterium]
MLLYVRHKWVELRRADFVRQMPFPVGLLERLEKRRPGLTRKDTALVSRALRQFFLAHLRSGRRFVSMPSQVVDDLWHEFILYTRDYQRFCKHAFGQFLHHTPAVALGKEHHSNEGLRRVWWYACREDNINPRHPSRLPLLFAIDAKLKIQDGFFYLARCEKLRDRDGGGGHCGGDFSSTSFDGTTDGFGDDFGVGDGDGSGGGDGCGGGGCGG